MIAAGSRARPMRSQLVITEETRVESADQPQALLAAVLLGHPLERHRLYLRGPAGASERLEACLADVLRSGSSRLQELTRIEFRRIARKRPPDGRAHGD